MSYQQFRAVEAGTLSSETATPGVYLRGVYNLSLTGTATATIQLERSFDGGTTWVAVSRDAVGTAATFQSTSAFAVSVVGEEPEQGVQYRLNCTSYTSGIINYRLSQ